MGEWVFRHPARYLAKKECAEGLRPSAGSLRVSLKHNFSPFLTRQRVEGMVEKFSRLHFKETNNV